MFYYIIAMCFMSCSRERIVNEDVITEWQGKQIRFPEIMIDVVSGDTLKFGDTDYLILTYIDSLSCTSCRMRPYLWQECLNKIDSVVESKVDFVMVIHPKDERIARFLLNRDKFEHSVVFDVNDDFEELNDFPTDIRLQTFLLDSVGKVVAIGNPTCNPNVMDLYIDVIGGSIKNDTFGNNAIAVSETSFDFGNVKKGQNVTHTFMLVNTGTDEYSVKDIVTSCECVSASLLNRKERIEPGDSAYISVSFCEKDAVGDFNRNIDVFFDNNVSNMALEIFGTVID